MELLQAWHLIKYTRLSPLGPDQPHLLDSSSPPPYRSLAITKHRHSPGTAPGLIQTHHYWFWKFKGEKKKDQALAISIVQIQKILLSPSKTDWNKVIGTGLTIGSLQWNHSSLTHDLILSSTFLTAYLKSSRTALLQTRRAGLSWSRCGFQALDWPGNGTLRGQAPEGRKNRGKWSQNCHLF